MAANSPKHVSKYFSATEIHCRCGCGKLPTEEMQKKLDEVRSDWGGPLYCTSGARCDKYTKMLRSRGIPADLKSAHIEGLAVDIRPIDEDQMEMFHKFCESRLEYWGLWMENPAHTPNWCHLQIRPVASGNRVFLP